ncbi:MAG: serine O-acetyltransferase [Parvularculaceae bacterium]
MAQPIEITKTSDPLEQIWPQMRVEAATAAAQEPVLASFLNAMVLLHETFSEALSYRIAQKLGNGDVNALILREVCQQAHAADAEIVRAGLADAKATFERDAACRNVLYPLLYFKGYQALQAYRIAHWLWKQERGTLALHLQSRISEIFDVDIHPGARIGRGIMIDHATGVVIGETAVVGDDVSLLHGVTLGGTGKESEDRHPKVGRGVLIGAGAKILGNISIGEEAKIASGSVVLKDVGAHCTVAGVPARPVGRCNRPPAESMDQKIYIDPDIALRRP